MAGKRVFISFAMEDDWARDYLVGQARNDRTPFEFTDMSVKEPWSEAWKTNCRSRIKGCAGVVALVSRNSRNAQGQLWEVACAKSERVPVRGIYVSTDNRPTSLPVEFSGIRVVDWTWANIKSFIDSL